MAVIIGSKYKHVVLYIGKCLYMYLRIITYVYIHTYTHIKYKGTASSVAILQLEKEACLNTVLKQLRHDRDEQCPTERTEELSGDKTVTACI